MLFEDKDSEVISLKFSDSYSIFKENPDKLLVAITFDDGYKNNLHTVAPILLDYGFPFTVFLTVENLDIPSSEYLSRKELIELASLPGVSIGSHGVHHSQMTELGDQDLRAELEDSRSVIEDIIGKKVDMLSYPHGKTDQRVRDTALDLGYRLGAGSRFGTNLEDADPMGLKRIELWSTDSRDIFRQKYSGAWDWYGYWQKLRGL
ncbi:MAG: polysaccharide deacetylase family protein [Deltaproteobacteria bacterium]|nr:polysaccharide deacetylase family protein [Deltaproteobacteria bacterium]